MPRPAGADGDTATGARGARAHRVGRALAHRPYFEGHPFLTGDAAETLAEAGAALVGIDSFNIDDVDDGRRPVHTTLLGAGIPIAEHLRGLEQLPTGGFRFSAVPVQVRGMGTFPVRAYADLD